MDSTPTKASSTPVDFTNTSINATPSVNEGFTSSSDQTPNPASSNSKTPGSVASSTAIPALTHDELETATISALGPYCNYWSLQEDWNKPFSDYIVHALNGEDVIGYIRFILFHRLHNGAEFKQIQSDYDSD